MSKNCVETMMTRIWQCFEGAFPVLKGDEDTATLYPSAVTENMLNDIVSWFWAKGQNSRQFYTQYFMHFLLNGAKHGFFSIRSKEKAKNKSNKKEMWEWVFSLGTPSCKLSALASPHSILGH